MPLCSSCERNAFTPRVSIDLLALHNRMRTECGPASVQPDEIATILQNVQQDLQDYESEIHHLQSRSVFLQAQMGRLQQYEAQVQSLRSLVRKIPDEILQYIFDDSCDTNEFIVVDAKSRVPVAASEALRSKPAMVLSAVCSRWRRNALAMSAIWSRISLQWKMPIKSLLEYDKSNNDAELLFPLYKFLSRSRRSPMTVSLSVHSGSCVEPGVLHPFLKQFSFVHQSAFKLTTLSFQSVLLSDSDLVHILVHVPTLNDLTIDDSGVPLQYSPISSEFIESLHGYHQSSLRPQAGPLMPRLRSLKLLNVGAAEFKDVTVVDMVQSRWIPDNISTVGTSTLEVDCLRVFTLTFRNRSRVDPGGIYDSLEPIEKNWMMIVVSWGG